MFYNNLILKQSARSLAAETIAWLGGLDNQERDKPGVSPHVEKGQKAMEKWRIERQTFPR